MYVSTTICLPSHRLMGIFAVSVFWLLWIAIVIYTYFNLKNLNGSTVKCTYLSAKLNVFWHECIFMQPSPRSRYWTFLLIFSPHLLFKKMFQWGIIYKIVSSDKKAWLLWQNRWASSKNCSSNSPWLCQIARSPQLSVYIVKD